MYNVDEYTRYQATTGQFFNYSKIMVENDGSDNFAPRKQMAYSTIWNPEKRNVYLTSTFTLLMTDREKQIELGTSWDYPPL